MIEASEIKSIRARLDETQNEFGERFNVRGETVNRWENGRCHPKKSLQKKIWKLGERRDK